MYIASPCSLNPLTGRKVWLVREIPTKEYGGDFVSSFVAVRRFYFSKNVEIKLAENVKFMSQLRQMKNVLRSLKFERAFATRHGIVRWYELV